MCLWASIYKFGEKPWSDLTPLASCYSTRRFLGRPLRVGNTPFVSLLAHTYVGTYLITTHSLRGPVSEIHFVRVQVGLQ